MKFKKDKMGMEVAQVGTTSSFRLSRPLLPGEQIDFSVVDDVKGTGLCGKWLRTCFAGDDDNVTKCRNVGRFTCYKVWVNKGLSGGGPREFGLGV
jgi:hypothetical protein